MNIINMNITTINTNLKPLLGQLIRNTMSNIYKLGENSILFAPYEKSEDIFNLQEQDLNTWDENIKFLLTPYLRAHPELRDSNNVTVLLFREGFAPMHLLADFDKRTYTCLVLGSDMAVKQGNEVTIVNSGSMFTTETTHPVNIVHDIYLGDNAIDYDLDFATPICLMAVFY